MDRNEKERVVAELAERLRGSQAVIVADFRGLTMTQIDTLRGRLLEHGARFSVVKNTLTRRAAEEAGANGLLALLEGPTAIAFIESGGDPVAVAKALGDAARDTRILEIRGGVLEGKQIGADDVGELAKLPPTEVLRSQLLGVIIAPLTNVLALVTAPMQNLVGLIDARFEQLEAGGAAAPAEAATAPAEAATASGEAATAPAEAATASAEAGEPSAAPDQNQQEEE